MASDPTQNFLASWEASRVNAHQTCRERAESIMQNLQLAARNAGSAVEAWMSLVETRRKLMESAACAAAASLKELEARWRTLRIHECDGEASQWLHTMEQQHVTALSTSASQWAATLPAGLADLRHRYISIAETIGGKLLHLVHDWDQSHDVVLQAWQIHFHHLQDASRAILEERTPPDVWLSEVQYRERARIHLSLRALAETELQNCIDVLHRLEAERSGLWVDFSSAYRQAHEVDCGMGEAPTSPSPLVAPKIVPAVGQAGPLCTVLPAMPSTGGAVLHLCRVAVPAQSGFFGLGGGGWQDGSTLVLTMHGYMHLFAPAKTGVEPARQPAPAATPPADGGEAAEDAEQVSTSHSEAVERDEELEVANILASVYVPMATRCLFLRKGKDRTLDIGEAEAVEQQQQQPERVGLGQGLRNLIRKPSANAEPKQVSRRINAKVEDEANLTALETRCHEFVRRGQTMRAFAATAKVNPPA